MADRYTYLPSVGLFIVAAWFAGDLLQDSRRRKLLFAAVSAVLVAVFAAMSWHYAGCWQDSLKLFKHATGVTERNYFAYNHIGLAYDAENDPEQARQAFERAIELNPGYDFGHNNLAIYYARNDRLAEAVHHLNIALQANPQYVDATSNMGVAYEMLSQFEQPERYLEEGERY